MSSSSKGSNDTGNLLDDLAGLSFQSNPIPFGQGGSITLGHDTSIMLRKSRLIIGMFSSSPSNTPGRVASPAFHQSPTNNPTTPDYSAFSSLQQSFSTPRIPSQPSQSYTPPTYAPPTYSQTTPVIRHTPNTSVDDDFGTFSSAVPETPINSVDLCNSANLTINLQPTRQSDTITLTAKFTNKQPVQIDEITFQMAIPRVLSIFLVVLIIVDDIEYESSVFKGSCAIIERWGCTDFEYFRSTNRDSEY